MAAPRSASEPVAEDPARLTEALQGLDTAAEVFLDCLARGRLHHAWLIVGPEGLGKAALAHRLARRLLGAKPNHAFGPAGSSPDDPMARLMLAGAHPDFILLNRYDETGKARRGISVDEARRLAEFFSKAPALAPFRVALIDAAEDLNLNAANALLKTLEEPPARGVLLLVSHQPGKLLPTVRSRCRRLSVKPWSEAQLADLAVARFGVSQDEAQVRARLAAGSPGRLVHGADDGGAKLEAAAARLMALGAEADPVFALTTAEMFRGSEGGSQFRLFIAHLCDQIADRVAGLEGGDLAARARWSEAWSQFVSLPDEVEGINLDRSDAFFSVVEALQRTARGADRSLALGEA